MSLSPLIDLPTSACMASVSMSLTRVVGLTESPYTLEEQSFKWPGEAWRMEFLMPTFTQRSIASDWISFALKLKGRYGHFLIGDPSAKIPRGVATGTPVVTIANQTGNILGTSGWTPSVTGILLKGDYIQLGSGVTSRLHMIVEDINSDAAGLANLVLEPALKTSPAPLSAIVTNNPRGVFRLVDNTWSWSVDPGPKYRLSFSAKEVV